MNDLLAIREQISQLDAQLLDLLAKRRQLAVAVAQNYRITAPSAIKTASVSCWMY